MSDTEPEPIVQHTEFYEEQHTADSDAADAPDAVPEASSGPTDSTDLQTELHAAEEPAEEDTETDSAKHQLSPIAGEAAQMPSSAAEMEMQQSLEADADSIADSRPVSVQQQQSDVGQQDDPDALPHESAPISKRLKIGHNLHPQLVNMILRKLKLASICFKTLWWKTIHRAP